MMSYIPTLKATNPDIARHILETDLPLQVNWELFYRMCLHKRRVADLRKKSGLEVYDVIVEGMPNSTSAPLESTEFNASLVLRDAADGPRLKSEVAATDPNIHHQAHRVEWRIPNMKQKTAAHVGVPPGKYCTSPPFAAAGVGSMNMRFWPSGYLNTIQFKDRYRFASTKQVLGWSCIGLLAPEGTALRVQFFIGSHQSPITDIYFDGHSIHSHQVWEPPQKETPEFKDGEELVVGCDIFMNLRFPRFTSASEPRMTTLGNGLLKRCLSSQAPTLHIDPAVGQRLAKAPIEIVSSNRYAMREKRYHPHATNILNSTTHHESFGKDAALDEVRALPAYGDDDSRPATTNRPGRDVLVSTGKSVFSQLELDEKFNEKFGPQLTTKAMSTVHNLGSAGSVWGPHSDVN
jgi:hypothetical protein